MADAVRSRRPTTPAFEPVVSEAARRVLAMKAHRGLADC